MGTSALLPSPPPRVCVCKPEDNVGLELTNQARLDGPRNSSASTSPELGLQTQATMSDIFTWVLGIELGSLCLQSKGFTT